MRSREWCWWLKRSSNTSSGKSCPWWLWSIRSIDSSSKWKYPQKMLIWSLNTHLKRSMESFWNVPNNWAWRITIRFLLPSTMLFSQQLNMGSSSTWSSWLGNTKKGSRQLTQTPSKVSFGETTTSIERQGSSRGLLNPLPRTRRELSFSSFWTPFTKYLLIL